MLSIIRKLTLADVCGRMLTDPRVPYPPGKSIYTYPHVFCKQQHLKSVLLQDHHRRQGQIRQAELMHKACHRGHIPLTKPLVQVRASIQHTPTGPSQATRTVGGACSTRSLMACRLMPSLASSPSTPGLLATTRYSLSPSLSPSPSLSLSLAFFLSLSLSFSLSLSLPHWRAHD